MRMTRPGRNLAVIAGMVVAILVILTVMFLMARSV